MRRRRLTILGVMVLVLIVALAVTVGLQARRVRELEAVAQLLKSRLSRQERILRLYHERVEASAVRGWPPGWDDDPMKRTQAPILGPDGRVTDLVR